MHILRYGNTNTYYMNGLLIDTDMPGTISGFYRELKRNGLTLPSIRYVMATHYHPDHMGLIGELMQKGVKLLLIDRQKDAVHFSDPIFRRQKGLPFVPIRDEDALVLSCQDSRRFLSDLGIRGELLPTDSHSADGVCLLMDEGDCFAGDLEPLAYLDGYGDNPLLQGDWERILGRKPKTVYFGHANPMKLK